MIIVVEPEDAPEHADLLEQAYRLRHRVFVDERGWQSWRKPDGRERDRFDPDGSISFLHLRDGTVVGNARLVPGGGLNPELSTPLKVETLAAHAPYVGLGRFCVEPTLRGGPKAMAIGAHLLIAVLEFARRKGFSELFFETDPWFVALLRFMKVRVETVGEPLPYYGRQMVMGIVPIEASTIAKCRMMLKLDRAALPTRELRI